jgi:hypothetical protein
MNTTHTSEPIEQKEKLKASRLLDELDLRDYFAAKAMQANRSRDSQYETWDDLARDAYEIADAMLKERNK